MSEKLYVLLVQLPVPNNPVLNTPLAAGYVKAYAAAQGLLDAVAIELLPRQLADWAGDALLVDTISARQPDVLGLSLYSWNSERSLALAQRVKARLPELQIVVGGPEVQRDNRWVLEHPAIDVAVIGEGEQPFVELLRLWSNSRSMGIAAGQSWIDRPLEAIAGIAYKEGTTIRVTPERVPLDDLSLIPSPYLAGYLELPADGMLMVEVSRWCPYACSFCLYGRNAGTRLGNRYFGLERVLAEIRWGRDQGIRRVHFVEANLNLVPLFWPLMDALADLNADHQMVFYAELRAEHLTERVVEALDRANLRVVEVGLQTANPVALKASQRRTDLAKWAAGARRLYAHAIEVLLDVIVGLPADDEAGSLATLDFIRREGLGTYDVFMLQVLPGTVVRQQASEFGLVFQERPPYYVLATSRLSYTRLRELRWRLKHEAGHDPEAIEGLPEPRRCLSRHTARQVITRLDAASLDDALIVRLGTHVDLVVGLEALTELTPWLEAAIMANPSTVFDLYLLTTEPPDPAILGCWREALPYTPGYLDRVAVYRRDTPDPAEARVSPRLWLVLPWTVQANPQDYAGVAEIIWRYDLAPGEEPPLGAWRGAGGAGIWVAGLVDAVLARHWEEQTNVFLWY